MPAQLIEAEDGLYYYRIVSGRVSRVCAVLARSISRTIHRLMRDCQRCHSFIDNLLLIGPRVCLGRYCCPLFTAARSDPSPCVALVSRMERLSPLSPPALRIRSWPYRNVSCGLLEHGTRPHGSRLIICDDSTGRWRAGFPIFRYDTGCYGQVRQVGTRRRPARVTFVCFGRRRNHQGLVCQHTAARIGCKPRRRVDARLVS